MVDSWCHRMRNLLSSIRQAAAQMTSVSVGNENFGSIHISDKRITNLSTAAFKARHMPTRWTPLRNLTACGLALPRTVTSLADENLRTGSLWFSVFTDSNGTLGLAPARHATGFTFRKYAFSAPHQVAAVGALDVFATRQATAFLAWKLVCGKTSGRAVA